MTIDKDLEARLQKLAPNARTGKIVIETAAVSDVSAYLAAEKIRHCSLPKCGKVIVGFANYQEMAKLDSTYPVQITRILPDARGTNALAKLDSSFSFNPWFRLGGNAPERDVYDVKDEGVSGL
ncbi:hypothetical protein HY639_04285, partial [Candidatus Woesearchaeota archaeon]|nr:hypothetical protein [Candidatus Woesearchaeota archaeon]